MDGGAVMAPVGIGEAQLFGLMPMAAILDAEGRITAAGPALARIAGPGGGTGRRFLDLFAVAAPEGPAAARSVAELGTGRIRLRLRDAPSAQFRAMAVPLAAGGHLVNLGFGAGLAEALEAHALTVADFAATDHAPDLLFLNEAKDAVAEELLDLARRMRGRSDLAEELALTDPLTGLANRRAFLAALDRAARSARRGQPFALLLIDLDRFKAVNDGFGHAAGDAVIAATAAALRAATRQADLAARLGGDEFAIILRNTAPAEDVAAIGRRLIAAIEEPLDWQGQAVGVSASIGIIRAPHPAAETPEGLLAAADAALYAAKRAGRGRCAEAPRPGDAPPGA